jgi:hypothetical protein
MDLLTKTLKTLVDSMIEHSMSEGEATITMESGDVVRLTVEVTPTTETKETPDDDV